MMSPKILASHKEKMFPCIEKWLASEHIYEIRFGLVMLMKHYLDENFQPRYLEKANSVTSDSYYVEMAKAWFFAEALTKQYKSTISYLTEKRLPVWVHNKTISKASDSFRIPKETKNFLKTLRISEKKD